MMTLNSVLKKETKTFFIVGVDAFGFSSPAIFSAMLGVLGLMASVFPWGTISDGALMVT